MQHDPRRSTVIVHHSTAIDMGLLAAGVVIGWFLGLASQVARRETQAGTTLPVPTSAPAKPPPLGERLVKWKNGAPWAGALNLVADTSNEISTGATLQDIRDLQTKTQATAQDAHAAAFIKFNQTQDVRYSKQADAINQWS